MPDGTYAPQSPDLSSFLSSASPQQKPPTSSYTPRSPNLPNFSTSAPTHAGNSREHSGLGIAYQPSPAQQYHSYDDSQSNPTFPPAQFAAQYGQYGQHPANLPQIPDLPPSHSFAQPQLQAAFHAQPFPPHQGQFRSDLAADAQLGYYETPNITGQPEMSTRGKRGAVKTENGAGSSGDLGPSQGIEIKTKFPVARIKRIMQADEEVGKVAQVTPVAVSKALELFMIELVTKSASLAKSSNSKRVTAQHLKKVIEGDDQYDFLAEIVGRVAEGPDAGGKRVKSEDGSDDEDIDKSGRSAKKAKGRRKKGE